MSIYDHLLFSVSINIVTNGCNISSQYINVDVFDCHKNIALSIAEIVYKAVISRLFKSKRTENNFDLVMDGGDLAKGIVTFHVFFMPVHDMEVNANYEKTIRSWVNSVIGLLEIERRYPNVQYVQNSNGGSSAYSQHLANEERFIVFSDPFIMEMTNRLEDVLNLLYEIDPLKKVELTMGDEKMDISGVQEVTISNDIVDLRRKEVLRGIAINGNQDQDKTKYLFKIEGSNCRYDLTHVGSNDHYHIMKRCANHNDIITIEAIRVIRSKRGIKSPLLKYKLVRLISYEDKGGNEIIVEREIGVYVQKVLPLD